MKKKYFIIVAILLLVTSCDYIKSLTKKKQLDNEPFIAKVNDVKLYISEIEQVIPKDLSLKDSLVFVKAYINSWAIQQLLLKKAEDNISEGNSKRFENLVKDYRQNLYINQYKERVIKQQLDTIISETDIEEYYNLNKENFRLDKPLFQLKYICFEKSFKGQEELIKKFRSNKIEDLEAIEEQTISFKDYHLRDSTWLTTNELYAKNPNLKLFSEEKLLKISKIIQQEDSLGVYLVSILNVLKKHDIAPVEHVSSQVKRLILHKRKIELTRKIEKTLLNDAIKNRNFTEY